MHLLFFKRFQGIIYNRKRTEKTKRRPEVMTRQLQKKRMEKMKKLTVLFAGLALFCLAADSPDSPYGVCAHVCKGEQWKLASLEVR